jgi:hypothetical protein
MDDPRPLRYGPEEGGERHLSGFRRFSPVGRRASGDQVKLQIWFSVTDHSLAALQHEDGFR